MTITHISERELALERENERLLNAIRVQAAAIEVMQAPVQPAPLTDEQIDVVTDKQWGTRREIERKSHRAYARAIESTIKEGGAT